MKAMKKILGFITITVIFLTIISIRAFAAEEVSINAILDKCPGDGVTIGGNTTFDIVSIKILYPNGDQYNVETVQSSSGSYSYTFKLPSDLPYGIYTVVAGKGNNVANTTFPVKQQDPGEEAVTINAIPDKYRGDSVTISGNTTFDIVSVKILYPNGDQYNVETVKSSSGSYSYTFKLPSDLPYGIYKVVSGRGDKVTSTDFKIVQKNNDAALSSIRINGTAISNFFPQTKNYTVTLSYGASAVPVVSATASDSKATIEITQAKSIAPYGTTPRTSHQATILVTAHDGITKDTYTVTFVSAQGTPESSDPDPEEPDEPEQEGTGPVDIKHGDTELDDEASDDDEEDINEDTDQIIEKIKELAGTPGISGKALNDMEKNLIKDLEISAYKNLVQRIEATVTDLKATIKLDEEAANSVINIMGDILHSIDELNKKLEKNGIKKKVEKKLTFLADADMELASIEAEIPSTIFKAAKEKGIDKIEIKSNTASFEIPPNFTDESKQGTTISINASKIELNNEEKSKLSEIQRQLLGEHDTIYEFSVLVDEQKVSVFDNKITVRLKYELKEGEDRDNITILYLADDGTIKNMAGKYDEKTGEVVFATGHFSKYLVKSLKMTFNDIEETFWGRKDIESMASKGVINGKPGGIFDPNGMVTRAEFAKMITIAMGIADDGAESTFSDVSESHWYYGYVASAANAGIVKGRPNNTFAPEDNISRQEMAIMIYRALDEATPKDAGILFNFNDWKDISDWAIEALTVIVNAEIMNGKPGNIIDPCGYSTRAEAAAVIYRFFNY